MVYAPYGRLGAQHPEPFVPALVHFEVLLVEQVGFFYLRGRALFRTPAVTGIKELTRTSCRFFVAPLASASERVSMFLSLACGREGLHFQVPLAVSASAAAR